MNLKQRRALNRAERRARLSEVKEKLKARALATRLSINADPLDVKRWMADADDCRNFGDVQRLYFCLATREAKQFVTL
jgi:hypothetical protein